MAPTLEKRSKVYYDCSVTPDDRGTEHEVVEGVIYHAYFGRQPNPGPFSVRSTLGLNVFVRSEYGIASVVLSDMEGIEGIMDDLSANTPRELKRAGNRVVCHIKGRKLIGISAPEGK